MTGPFYHQGKSAVSFPDSAKRYAAVLAFQTVYAPESFSPPAQIHRLQFSAGKEAYAFAPRLAQT
jgi:hypothetical protein